MKKPSASTCELKPFKVKAKPLKSRLYKHKPDFGWSGVVTEKYKTEDSTWSAVLRRAIIGGTGENVKFHLRYFEIAPGGRTTHEHHKHEHAVICIRGKGICKLSGKNLVMKPFDTLYISPDEPHQLINTNDEPFGFFCIVDAKRDRPKVIKR